MSVSTAQCLPWLEPAKSTMQSLEIYSRRCMRVRGESCAGCFFVDMKVRLLVGRTDVFHYRPSFSTVNLFETIGTESRAHHLQFLVIGGLAVNLYGYPRETADLDLLICSSQRTEWLDLFSRIDFTIYHDGGNFIQLSSAKQTAWPVDLMLVQEKTFQPMLVASREFDLYGTRSRIPSLEHLLALKLHSLKNTRLHRFLKDYLDVESLVRINKLDLKSENIRQLFLKYGTVELYEKISRSLANE